jgi:hypothetical protein
MKVRCLKSDDRHLSIQLTPTGEWLLIALGGFLMLLGPIIVYLLGWVVTIDMRDGVFAHQQSLLQLFWTESKTLRYSEIQHFNTEIRQSAVATSMVAVIQKTDGQAEDLRLGDMSGDDKELLVEQLNTALQGPGIEFQYSSDPGAAIAGSLILGGTMLVAGAVCFYFLQIVWISGDRGTGKLCVHKRRRLSVWPMSPAQCIAISDFSHIASSEFAVATAGGPSASSRFLSLATIDGQSVPLAHGPMFTEASSQQISQLITAWVERSPHK